MLINYLQPVVKEMLKGWLLSLGAGGGSEELSLDNTGRLRPKGVPFSGFQVMDDSQWRFLAQQSVTLRCIDMNGCDFVPTLNPTNNNSLIQDYVHPDDHPQPTYEMTPGFKPLIFIPCAALKIVILNS